MSEQEVAARISRRFDSYFLRGYVVGKLMLDPMYRAVHDRVAGSSSPIVDVGCGIGLLGLYLRERGVTVPIRGFDFDQRKVSAGRRAASGWSDLDLQVRDARDVIEPGSTVLLLDVLHYFTRDDQRAILRNAASAATMVIIRDALRDSSWRYRATVAAEAVARAARWLKAERLNFLSLEEIQAELDGFDREVLPMRGRTPFNNYMLVFRRASSGTTIS